MSHIKEHTATLLLAQKTIDLLVLIVSSVISYWLVFDSFQLDRNYPLALAIAMILSFLVFPFCSLYRAWRGASRFEEIRVFCVAWCILFALLALAAIATKTAETFSRIWFTQWFVIGGMLSLTFRMMLRTLLGYIRKRGFNQRHIVIVGNGEHGQEVAKMLRASPWLGLTVKGFFADSDPGPSATSETPLLGGLSDIDIYVVEHDIDQVWIALGLQDVDRIETIINRLSLTAVDIRFVPDVSSFKLINHSVSAIGGISIINVSVTPMEGTSRILKAFEDRLLSVLILLLMSPLMLVIAMVIKASSRGPVFYRQRRLGWNGEHFTMLKFRTMPVGADNGGAQWGSAQQKQTFPFGRFLRCTSLDELPQFINVLLGQMSIVGPRPERPQFVERFKHEIPGYMQKHMVKAGITGWAQINGWRGDTDLKKRIEYDMYYIENWSFWFDLKIIFLTLFKGFVNKNAY